MANTQYIAAAEKYSLTHCNTSIERSSYTDIEQSMIELGHFIFRRIEILIKLIFSVQYR